MRTYIEEKEISIMNTIGEILAEARKDKHLSQPELAKELAKMGIHKSYKSISTWEQGLAEPSCTILMALSKILGITDIYDRYYGDTPEHPYTLLNYEGKAKADEYIQLLVDSGKYAKNIAECVEFPSREVKLFYLPASAGPGEFLDSSDGFDMVALPENAPKETDFMIRIQGDSMEPQFTDGETVYVKQQETVENGEVGIFGLDGKSYIKKFRSTPEGSYLISLNPKYDPIPINSEYFVVFGKVLG
jgi:SOS-response transcriptional repressor LexA